MKHSLLINLELDVDEASADAQRAGRTAEERARELVGEVMGAGVRVVSYSVVVVPVSRAALDAAMRRVADVAQDGGA